MYLGLAFIEGCHQVRGGLYEGFHYNCVRYFGTDIFRMKGNNAQSTCVWTSFDLQVLTVPCPDLCELFL